MEGATASNVDFSANKTSTILKLAIPTVFAMLMQSSVNVVDDVRIFARAAISNPHYPTVPTGVVRGVRLQDCCSWRELDVREIDSTPPRSRIDAVVVHRNVVREFIGFNRARHAVLEAAIYATRLHLLPREFITSEFERLQVIVDKTAGPAEQEALDRPVFPTSKRDLDPFDVDRKPIAQLVDDLFGGDRHAVPLPCLVLQPGRDVAGVAQEVQRRAAVDQDGSDD